MAGPRRTRFAIIEHKIILLNRQTFDLTGKLTYRRTHKSFPEIDSARLSENKTQSVKTVFHLKRQRQVCLDATDQHVYLTMGPETGNNVHRAAQMPVARALYGIQYLHNYCICVGKLMNLNDYQCYFIVSLC